MDTITVRVTGAGRKPSVAPFAAVPHALYQDRRLTATDRDLVAALLYFARDRATCWPSVATLAGRIGRCRRTVQLGLARLRATGWVTTRRAANPTGRELVLIWRDRPAPAPAARAEARPCAPAQPYSQGLPRTAVAPQGRIPRGEGEASPPAIRRRTPTPTGPRPIAELAELFGGWLSDPRLSRFAPAVLKVRATPGPAS